MQTHQLKVTGLTFNSSINSLQRLLRLCGHLNCSHLVVHVKSFSQVNRCKSVQGSDSEYDAHDVIEDVNTLKEWVHLPSETSKLKRLSGFSTYCVSKSLSHIAIEWKLTFSVFSCMLIDRKMICATMGRKFTGAVLTLSIWKLYFERWTEWKFPWYQNLLLDELGSRKMLEFLCPHNFSNYYIQTIYRFMKNMYSICIPHYGYFLRLSNFSKYMCEEQIHKKCNRKNKFRCIQVHYSQNLETQNRICYLSHGQKF
jgi:hypothetical protein